MLQTQISDKCQNIPGITVLLQRELNAGFSLRGPAKIFSIGVRRHKKGAVYQKTPAAGLKSKEFPTGSAET